MTRQIGEEYDRYHEIVPDDVHVLTNEVGMIIAQLVDALVATKFHTSEQRMQMLESLKKIGVEIGNFNSQANSMHVIAQMTTIEPEVDEGKRL